MWSRLSSRYFSSVCRVLLLSHVLYILNIVQVWEGPETCTTTTSVEGKGTCIHELVERVVEMSMTALHLWVEVNHWEG